MRVDGTGRDRSQGGMSTLTNRNVLASSVRRVVRGVAVIRGHGMPKGAPCCREARNQVSQNQLEISGRRTHEFAMIGDSVKVVVAATLTVWRGAKLNYNSTMETIDRNMVDGVTLLCMGVCVCVQWAGIMVAKTKAGKPEP